MLIVLLSSMMMSVMLLLRMTFGVMDRACFVVVRLVHG